MLCFNRQDVQVKSSNNAANDSHGLSPNVISVETRGLSRRFGSLLAVDDLNISYQLGANMRKFHEIVFARAHLIPTGGISYLDFIVPVILAQSVLFIAIFYGISVIWERDLGILQKFLVSPASRYALVLGRALSAGVRGLSQAAIVYVLALILGVHLRLGLNSTATVLMAVMAGSAIFGFRQSRLFNAPLRQERQRREGRAKSLTANSFKCGF
jgi:ABC-type multidrug transport system permease subunit